MPVEKAISNLMDMLQNDFDDLKKKNNIKIGYVKHVKQLMEVCLYKCYFLWNNQIHSVKDSGPIGLLLMVVLEDSFLQMIESKSLNIVTNRSIPVGPIRHKCMLAIHMTYFWKKNQVKNS